MSASNRAGAIAKLHSALKKHYHAEPAQPTRPLLEHILYASLLEDCPAELADEGLAKCEQEFFDWNEVRVTTVTELSQVLSRLPDPVKAATRLKSNLQSIFEEFYSFDLDHLKKENLGKAVAKFEKMPGMTPFVLNYTIQHGLGGHAIPIDFAAMAMMLVTGIASQTEAVSGRVPGLERAIPKSKAMEFSSLLHQAAVALNKNSHDKVARGVLDSVEKGASNRLDDWLSNKVEAKKQRQIQREADRVAAEEADNDPAPAPEPKAKTSKKSASSKDAPMKSAAESVEPRKVEKPASESTKSSKTEKPAAGKPASSKSTPSKPATGNKSEPVKSSAAKAEPAKPDAAKSGSAKPSQSKSTESKTSTSKPAPVKPVASKTAAKKPSAKKSGTPESKSSKTPSKKSTPPSKKTPPATDSKKSSAPAAKSNGSKKSANRKLTKSKPR